MKPVIGQSGTVYRSDTLEPIVHIDYLYLGVKRLAELIREFMSRSAQAMNQFVTNFLQKLEGIAETNKQIEKDRHIRRTWSVDKDTRLRSQVIDNKPKQPIRRL